MIIHKARLPLRWMLTFGIPPSPLKILFYRWRGARIGRGVELGFGSGMAIKGPAVSYPGSRRLNGLDLKRGGSNLPR